MDNNPLSTKFVIVRWTRRHQAIVFVSPDFQGKAVRAIRAAFGVGPAFHPICDEQSPLLDDLTAYSEGYDLLGDGSFAKRCQDVAASATRA